MTPHPEATPAAIAAQALALPGLSLRDDSRGMRFNRGNQATSTPTTTDARWGHFKPSRRGQRKPSFLQCWRQAATCAEDSVTPTPTPPRARA